MSYVRIGKSAEELHDDELDENSKIFPQRLMEILSEPSNSDSITWLHHGKAFIIVNRKKFSNQILPKYFRKTKYTSFTRKLNRWNFTRITRGPELGAYYHEFFQRESEALCTQMYCKNDRAKFAVTSKTSNRKNQNDDSSDSLCKIPSSTPPTDPPIEQPLLMPSTGLSRISGSLPKVLSPPLSPSLQALAGRLGCQLSMAKDPVTQTMINNSIRAFQSPLGLMPLRLQDGTALFRFHQLAAIKHQLQALPPTRQMSSFTNYRASAA